jgi:hypothetical protein
LDNYQSITGAVALAALAERAASFAKTDIKTTAQVL